MTMHSTTHDTDTETSRKGGRIASIPTVWCWDCNAYVTPMLDSDPVPEPGTLPELAEWEAQQASDVASGPAVVFAEVLGMVRDHEKMPQVVDGAPVGSDDWWGTATTAIAIAHNTGRIDWDTRNTILQWAFEQFEATAARS